MNKVRLAIGHPLLRDLSLRLYFYFRRLQNTILKSDAAVDMRHLNQMVQSYNRTSRVGNHIEIGFISLKSCAIDFNNIVRMDRPGRFPLA